MADPVSILGTVVGVASLVIQVTETLQNYWKGVSVFQTHVEQMLGDMQRLNEVLSKLREFLERDKTKLSQAFGTTSTLYSASVSCEVRLKDLIEALRRELEGSKRRKIVRALRWPFKAEETNRISIEIRSYTQTFQFALTLDGCELLLQTSDDVCQTLKDLTLRHANTEQQAEDVRTLLDAISSLPRTTDEIHKILKRLEVRAHAEAETQILDWLNLNSPSTKHQTMRNARLAQTGQWIFDDLAYSQWHNGVAPIFWGQGKPGVGKSVLLSCVVDRLVSEKRHDEGVAYFYCDYSRVAEAQSAVAIVTSLLHQLLLQLEYIPEEILSLCQDHRRQSSRPNLSESAEMLHNVLDQFSATWLLVDALDELEANAKDDLMEVVESLKNNAKFFFTSRAQSLDSALLEESTLHCTLSAHNEDLATYIRARMGKAATASRRVRKSPGWNDFVDETVGKLVSIADGMFILVSLQLDMLLRPRTLAEMRRLLEGVSDKLDDFYAATLERIKARESAVAVNVLCWLVKQMEPLTADALQEALAVEESTQSINPEAFIHEDDMIEMCCGLLVMDEDGLLSLAHATIHEFLSARLDEVKPFDYTIAKTCLKYLTFESFQYQTSNYGRGRPDGDNLCDREYIDRTQQRPFFSYAAYHWGTHYKRCAESDELTEMALRLIGAPDAATISQLYNNKKVLNLESLGRFHVSAYLAQLQTVKMTIALATEEVLESKSQDPASDLGRLIDCSAEMVVSALLQMKAFNPSLDRKMIKHLGSEIERVVALMNRPNGDSQQAARPSPIRPAD